MIGEMFHLESGARTLRQRDLPGMGATGQKRLSESTVLVAGIGGVGGVIAQYLAMAGVGRLVLVHSGTLDLPDLNRQTLMDIRSLGRPRVQVAASRIGDQVPDCRIDALDRPVEEDLFPLVSEADFLVDARLNFTERYTLNKMAVEAEKPLCVVAMNGMEGLILTVNPGVSACFRCVFPEADPEWDPLGFPVLGALSGTMGSLASLRIIRSLLGLSEKDTPSDDSSMLFFDGDAMTFRHYRTHRLSGCPDCGEG